MGIVSIETTQRFIFVTQLGLGFNGDPPFKRVNNSVGISELC